MTTTKTPVSELVQRFNKEGAHRLLASIEKTDTKTRTINLAFSSEKAEVPRFFGYEILGHSNDEVRLDRMNNSAPLLMDHDARDQIGIVENARIDADKTGRAVVRFGNSPRASEIFQDVQDGIRKHVSVGYWVHGMKHTGTRDDEEVYRVTDWEPFEVSLVSVPADAAVGIGRSLSGNSVDKSSQKQENNDTEFLTSSQERTQQTDNVTNMTTARPHQTEDEIRNSARSQEQKRINDILEVARQYDAHDLGSEHACNPNGSVETLQRALLERRGKSVPVSPKNSDIGMETRDLKKYSVLRAIRAMTSTDPRERDKAGFELELSQEAEKNQSIRSSNGIIIPSDVLRNPIRGNSPFGRSVNLGHNNQTSPGNTGGSLVEESLSSGNYFEILRNKAVFVQGATILSGLVGNINIPKQTSGTKGFWVGEEEDVTESSMDFGKVGLSPKTVGATTDASRELILQSSLDAEALIRSDLAKSMGLAIDYSGYYGTGSDSQPRGLANITGIETLMFAGEQPTYKELVEMETIIANSNADVLSMRYKARPDFRGYAKSTLAFDAAGSEKIWEPGNTVNGYACDITGQIERGDVFFGNFNDVLMGMWGGLELIADPYTKSTSGSVRITTFQSIDWQVRRPESFVLGRSQSSKKQADKQQSSNSKSE